MSETKSEGLSVRTRVLLVLLIVVLLLIVPLGRGMMFVVNERELAVVRQFGDPVGSCTEPGLYFKIPFIQEVHRLPKTLQFWTGAGGGVLVDLPTADGKKLEVTPWAVWKITDPVRFVEVLRTMENAQGKVKDAVRSAVRDVITMNKLVDAVRSSDRTLEYPVLKALAPEATEKAPSGTQTPPDVTTPDLPLSGEQTPADVTTADLPLSGTDERVTVGRKKIVDEIKAKAQQRLAKTEQGEEFDRGIELIDVGIAKIEFVETVRKAAFDRLIAFYESIASKYDNEGKRTKQEILNRTDAEVQKILGEGRQESNTKKGTVDAEIIDLYAKAINETGEFYNFVRTLEAYKEALGSSTRLILTTDSGLLQLLQEAPPITPGSSGNGSSGNGSSGNGSSGVGP